MRETVPTRWGKYIGGWKSGQRNDEKDTWGLSDIAIRHEAQVDAQPQALKTGGVFAGLPSGFSEAENKVEA